jgi:hypothetical protein
VIPAVLAVGAGCGGEPPAEEAWADSVCSDVGAWQDQVEQAEEDIRTALQSPGAETLSTIDTAIRQATDATRTLADELEALEAPNPESGAQAKQQLDDLAAQLESTATEAREILDSVSEGTDPLQAVQQLAALAPEVESAVANAASTLEAVQASGSDLREGFQDADSCEQFRAD